MIKIIFDGPPSHESGRFVEVENADGQSIRCGEWVENGEYWELHITSIPNDSLTKERDELVVMLRTLRLDDQQNRSHRDAFERERDRYRKALEDVEKKNGPDGREIPAWHKISIANTVLKDES